MTDLTCAAGYCTSPAVTAVHRQVGGNVQFRPDHLVRPDIWGADFRCLDCAHHELDLALADFTWAEAEALADRLGQLG